MKLFMKLFRACLSFVLMPLALFVVFFVVFCLALAVQAAPAGKRTKPIVKIGQAYNALRQTKAARRHPMSAAEADALYLYWRDSVQFASIRKSSLKNEQHP